MKLLREEDRRSFWLFVFLAVLSAVIIVKLYVLQITKYDDYQKDVIKNIQHEVNLPAERGVIYDRNGFALATNIITYRLFVSPSDILSASDEDYGYDKTLSDDENEKNKKKYIDKKLNLICTFLSEVSDQTSDQIKEKIEKYNKRKDITIQKNLDEITAEKVRDFIKENEIKNQIYLQSTSKRYYPYSDVAASIIGFSGTDGGLIGVELKYDSLLSGTPGKYITARDAKNQSIPSMFDSYVEPQNGYNAYLTIDITIQSILEEQLQKTYYESKAANRVTGIVMNPNNGEIYAMGTYPTFDLNNPYELVSPFKEQYETWTYDPEKYPEMTEEEAKNEFFWEMVYKMWSNKAISDLYEPGSTFKMITTATALEEKATSFNDSYTCTGVLDVSGVLIHCHKTWGHGTKTFDKMLQLSCNPTIMQVAAKIGTKTFYSYFEKFGYTTLSGIDLPGEALTLHVPRSSFNSVELACYSFGQTFKTTAIQQLSSICTVANGGYIITPHIVSKLTDSDGNVIKDYNSYDRKQIVSSQVSESIMAVLSEGVASGNGVANAYIAGYRVAAKTGTSEKRDTKDEEDRVGSCVAIAPADDPQVCVIIIVDEPTIDNKYGANVAAPYVKSVMEPVLEYLGVERVYSSSEMNRISIELKDYKGKKIDEVKSDLEKLELNYEIVGSGTTVIDQVPTAKSLLTKINSKIIIYTNGSNYKEKIVVPDLINEKASVGINRLNTLGFNVYVKGATNYNAGDGAVIVEQDIEPGKSVDYGTVIMVRCKFLDQTDDDSDIEE